MDINVFIAGKEATCSECGENLGRHAWITLVENQGPVCLSCADLDHLEFLPSGDAALTRRAGKYSTLKAIVLQWSRSRKRYERQGILVKQAALTQAEEECLADADLRAIRRERDAERREWLDLAYLAQFAERVRELYPHCPPGREQTIAEHACEKYSGRVGRSASAKALDEAAITLAVTAHIRHSETQYDDLLAQGYDRFDAREMVWGQIKQILESWR
jgi:hypothetical protein